MINHANNSRGFHAGLLIWLAMRNIRHVSKNPQKQINQETKPQQKQSAGFPHLWAEDKVGHSA